MWSNRNLLFPLGSAMGGPCTPLQAWSPHIHTSLTQELFPCSQWWLRVESWWEGGAGPQASPGIALPGSQLNKRSEKRRLCRSLLRPRQEGGSLGPTSCHLYQNVKIKEPVLLTWLCLACSACCSRCAWPPSATFRSLPPVHAQLLGVHRFPT